jgi:retron-type reverse transcriptase
MITYREFSSLSRDLGFSGRTLYGVSHAVTKHYRPVRIPKRGGGTRELHIPDPLLKAIQTRIAETLLPLEEISPCASAYRPGGSTKRNALPHVGRQTVLKLDISGFFDRITYPLVKKKAFPASRYSESNRVLLSMLCVYKDSLPQGAPTSPAISNIVMKDFDDAVWRYCAAREIAYTRYCDDMTFSGDFDPAPLIAFVKARLKKMGFFLNEKKTAVLRQGRRQQVTGVVVNERPGVPAEYKRAIRQAVHYCEKYGVADHLSFRGDPTPPADYLMSLMGRVNYVLSIEPQNEEMRRYKTLVAAWLKEAAQPKKTPEEQP